MAIDSPSDINHLPSYPSNPGGTARQEIPNLPGVTDSYINPCSRVDVADFGGGGSLNPREFDGPVLPGPSIETSPTVQGTQGVNLDSPASATSIKPGI